VRRLVPLQEIDRGVVAMACVNADGTLSTSGRAMLDALAATKTASEVASATGLPLFRVRSGLRISSPLGSSAKKVTPSPPTRRRSCEVSR